MAIQHDTAASRRTIAKIAGVGYLGIIALGIFGEFIVRSSIIEAGDAGATASGIVESATAFRAGIAGELVMLALDATVGLALFLLLRPVREGLALLATFFRLVHTAMYGVTLLTLFIVLQLLSGAEYLAAFEPGQRDALALLFLEVHGYGYTLALIFFAVHVGILGYLGLRHGAFPAVLSALLVFAAAGYLVDSFAQVLLANYEDYEALLGVVVFGPAVIGETSLGLWLLLRGGKTEPTTAGEGAPALRAARI